MSDDDTGGMRSKALRTAEYADRDNRDLLIEAVVTLKGQAKVLAGVQEDLKSINDRCQKLTVDVLMNKSEIKDLNTRWKIMVGIVGFVIITLVAVAGVVVAYMT